MQLFYMGIVIYVPATAMEAVTGFPVWASVIITATVATVYTTLVRTQLRKTLLCTLCSVWFHLIQL